MDKKTCSIDGCTAPHKAKGLCDNHYRQQRQKNQRSAARALIVRDCTGCGQPIPSERILRGDVSYCTRDCKRRHYSATGRSAEVNLRSYYKRRYGLSMEEVEAMRERGCGICGTRDFGGRFEKGHIDHCHETGVVRGVLCDFCNRGLGLFRDDPSTLRRAAKYVGAHDRTPH